MYWLTSTNLLQANFDIEWLLQYDPIIYARILIAFSVTSPLSSSVALSNVCVFRINLFL